MNVRDRANLEQFMNNGAPQNSFQFQPMRHELNAIQNQPNAIHQQQSNCRKTLLRNLHLLRLQHQ